jgi:hypothetical protein
MMASTAAAAMPKPAATVGLIGLAVSDDSDADGDDEVVAVDAGVVEVGVGVDVEVGAIGDAGRNENECEGC